MKTQHPLDAWRRQHKWTQAQLARAIGCTEATVSRLFAGERAGLSKRAALNAFVITSGSVDLRTLLLGADSASCEGAGKTARRGK